jgi:hypothetical protein
MVYDLSSVLYAAIIVSTGSMLYSNTRVYLHIRQIAAANVRKSRQKAANMCKNLTEKLAKNVTKIA